MVTVPKVTLFPRDSTSLLHVLEINKGDNQGNASLSKVGDSLLIICSNLLVISNTSSL